MTLPGGIPWGDIAVLPPRPADGNGAGAGTTMHLWLPGYRPSPRRTRSTDNPLCGQFARCDPDTARTLDWLAEHQQPSWVWCKPCLGHLVHLLDKQGAVIGWLDRLQQLDREIRAAQTDTP